MVEEHNEVIKTILNRSSVRAFKKKVSMGDLSLILKAGLAAPSGKNLQECNLVVLIEERSISKTIQTIEKAKNIERYTGFYRAPVLVLVCAPREAVYGTQDSACIIENILIAATSLKLGGTWNNQLTTISDNKDVINLLSNFGITSNYKVYGTILLGYPLFNESKEKQIDAKNRISYIT